MKMLLIETAKKIAFDFVSTDFDLSSLGDHIEIIDEKTVSLAQGWVFFYNSAQFLKTKEFGCMLMGNKPVFVDIESGKASYIRHDLDIQAAISAIQA